MNEIELRATLDIVRKTKDLQDANDLLNGFGIEFVCLGDRELKYVNLGDTYTKTICEENGEVFICSWGSWYEEAEQKFELENDVIRCGYCSYFTPRIEGVSWEETVCEQCGNKVGGWNVKSC